MGRGGDRARFDVHPVVFWTSAGIIVAILVLSVLATDQVGSFFRWVQGGIVERFGWFYILSMTGFLGFTLWLMLSRFGHIKLGADDSEPEFSRPTWFAMLFSAGMGIGLLFFSVAEPIMHYANPPSGEGNNLAAAREAMGLTFLIRQYHETLIVGAIEPAMPDEVENMPRTATHRALQVSPSLAL